MLHVKESTFSTADEQRKRATCRHVPYWHPPVLLFGYMPVYGICVLCRTRFSAPAPDYDKILGLCHDGQERPGT